MTLPVGNSRPSYGARALTLIEIMAVMGIMIIIVSSIVIAAYGVQRRGAEKGTEGLLDQIALALENYRVTYRRYVPQPSDIEESDLLQIQDSTQALWFALEHQEELLEVSDSYKQQGGSFISPETGARMKWYFYRDAWRNPLLYQCFGENNRFEIRSAGRDLEYYTGDDIVKE